MSSTGIGSPRARRLSRETSMASRTSALTSSKASPWVWQPRQRWAEAMDPPSSSRSMITVYVRPAESDVVSTSGAPCPAIIPSPAGRPTTARRWRVPVFFGITYELHGMPEAWSTSPKSAVRPRYATPSRHQPETHRGLHATCPCTKQHPQVLHTPLPNGPREHRSLEAPGAPLSYAGNSVTSHSSLRGLPRSRDRGLANPA